MADFFIKENDTLPEMVATLIDENDAVVDLTNSTSIKFIMRRVGEATAKVDSAMVIVNPPGTDGKVKYSWTAGDTDTPAEYEGEIEVTWSGGGVSTFPNYKFLVIEVKAELEV